MIRDVAPCPCGSAALAPAHLEQAASDPVCAERVADVQLLVRMRAAGEDQGHVPEYRNGRPDRDLADVHAGRWLPACAPEPTGVAA